MSSLFIIANGFDLAHGLKTSYEDFHKYLKVKYPNAKPTSNVPEYVMDNHGEEIPSNLDDVIGFIEQLLCDVDGDKWSNLESALGKIDFDNYIDDYENDDDLFHEEYHNEDCAMSLIYPILDIPSYFSRWISTIDINKAIKKKDFEKIIDKDSDMFLSFNYTETLESLYGVLGVCHIHGVQDEKLLFGHGNDYDYFSDDNYGRQIGTESSFQEIHDKLKKDTKGAINDNISFLMIWEHL